MNKKSVLLTILMNIIVISATAVYFIFFLKINREGFFIYRLVWLSLIEALIITSISVSLFHRKMQGKTKLLTLLLTLAASAVEIFTLFFAPKFFNIETGSVIMNNILLIEYGAHFTIFFIIFTIVCEPSLIISIPILNVIAMVVTFLMFFINFKQKDYIYYYKMINLLLIELLFFTFFELSVGDSKVKILKKIALVAPILALSLTSAFALFFSRSFPKTLSVECGSPALTAALLASYCFEIVYFLTLYLQNKKIHFIFKLLISYMIASFFSIAIFIILKKDNTIISIDRIISTFVIELILIAAFTTFFNDLKIKNKFRFPVLIASPLIFIFKFIFLFFIYNIFKYKGVTTTTIIFVSINAVEVAVYIFLYLISKNIFGRKEVKKTLSATVKPPFKAYKGNSKYIFISYAHKNMRKVFEIAHNLYKNGYNVWYDEGIEPGTEWPEIIGKAIINCSQFMVFISGDAVRSRNVRNEINFAFNHHKKILVIYLENTPLSHGLELQIGTVQSIKKNSTNDKDFYATLKKSLEK